MNQIRPLSLAQLADMGIKSPQVTSAFKQKVKQAARGRPSSGAIEAPAFEITSVFAYQSYFSDSLAERALLRQNPNEPIVQSTMPDEPVQQAGCGLALHPSSEAPVAVQFETGSQQGKSMTYRLKPGEVIFPQGGNGTFFTGFNYGLPFGWLGGGSVKLILLRSPHAVIGWSSDHNEVVYHRIRLRIVAPADLPVNAGVYNGPINWPQRFPWPFAQFGTGSLTQRGQPAFSVSPTRTAMSLRLATLTAPAAATDNVMRMYWVGADVWAQDANGDISLADVRATDQTWNTWAQQAGAAAPFNAAYQTMLLTGEAERYAANAGALALASEDADLQGVYVDIVRWGRL